MKKKTIWALATALLALLATGCAAQTNGQTTIVTSFYPMYVLTLNVTDGIDGVTVQNMAEQNVGCLHDYQLQTRDMVTLEGADALVINGGGAIDAGDGQLRGKPLERVREQKCLMNVALRQRIAQRQERGILRKAAEMGEVERRIVPVQREAVGKINGGSVSHT